MRTTESVTVKPKKIVDDNKCVGRRARRKVARAVQDVTSMLRIIMVLQGL
jgi:hypothetical protein